ncbi:MAG: hypothetical protein WCF78_01570 [archaeon]
MEIVISDSSTLILLSKSKLLIKLIQFIKIYIPKIVYSEVLKGKEKNYSDAFEIENLVTNQKIVISEPSQKMVNEIAKLYKIDIGELYAIALAKELNKIILIDDKKGINACKSLHLKLYTSWLLLFEMHKNKFITCEDTKESLNLLIMNGRFNKYEIEEMNKLIM